jgi:hypothetical protein
MARFDTLQEQVHDITASTFGEMAAWTPSTGGAEQRVQVNFNQPDKPEEIGELSALEWEFSRLDTWMEYRHPQFPTLHDLVATKTQEAVAITDQNNVLIGTYRVTKVMRMNDGKTFKAQLVALP